MDKIHLIHPSFFANRLPRRSRNILSRIRNRHKVSGPTLLMKNTLLGLKRIGICVVKNPSLYHLNQNPIWLPSGDLALLSQAEIELLSKTNLTLGPNIDFFKVDNIDVISKLKHVKILVPHHWVISPLRKILPNDCQILIWYSGIDTDFWQKKRNSLREREVLIYLKNSSDVENLKFSKEYLRKHELRFTVLEYGSYTQSQFKSILNRVNAAIWIGGTESQGLALLECWAMNVPTLVLKKETWYNSDGQPFPASSAPYMSDPLGQFSNSTDFSEDDFERFFSGLKDFSPRESVQETFNLAICASSLLKVLNE